jgi:hypothetical protein
VRVFVSFRKKSAKRMAQGRKRRPYGTPVLFCDRSFPALKRWANNHCAYGAGWGAWACGVGVPKPVGLVQSGAAGATAYASVVSPKFVRKEARCNRRSFDSAGRKIRSLLRFP